MTSDPKIAHARRTVVIGLIALVLSTTALGAIAAGKGYAGRSLADALVELREQGLRILFTSHVVRPDMWVRSEPRSREPREVLAELLAPHGLTFEEGPGGRLVVVPRSEPLALDVRGVVRNRQTGEPVANAQVLIPKTDHDVRTAADGTFVLDGVEPGTWTLAARHPGYVVHYQEVELLADEVELILELDPAPLALEKIVVTPSRISLLREDPAVALSLTREEILALPHLGDDIFRSMTLLPGVAGEEVSASFSIRGGRPDEVLVLFDRVELFDPFHLQDFGRGLSIIPPKALGEVDLITGGLPAEYGGRMSGVLSMNTRLPVERQYHLGMSIVNVEAGGSGTFGDGRGLWLGVARYGVLALTLDFLGNVEEPEYWDGFGKLEYRLGDRQSLALHVLYAGDQLDFISMEEGTERFLTDYSSTYSWLAHQLILSERLFADTVFSVGEVTRDRRGFKIEDEDEFSIRDQRTMDAVGLKQDWNFQSGGRHYLKWGFDVRRLDTDYDYLNLRVLEDTFEEIRSEPRTGVTSLVDTLTGESYSFYVADRIRPHEAVTLELGLRWDDYDLAGDKHLSPRFNLVWVVGTSSTLRAAWGHFYQSQRSYELQVEDGETTLYPDERTEHRVLGFEHAFDTSGLMLRVEAYDRPVRDPRRRYENLLEPVSTFSELEPDRYRVLPESSSSRGVELFLRGRAGKRVEWWGNYTYSEAEDRIDGRDVPRRIDQPQAFNFDFDVRAGEHWHLNFAWRYHTGWPTTVVSGRIEEDDEGELEVVPTFGPINGERLPAYHRLDLRASREWHLRKGNLTFFLEVQNVYDRLNVAGFDVDEFELKINDDGEVEVEAVFDPWGGILPSFGITWDF